MSDSRILRIQELKRLQDDARKRVEELKIWREIIVEKTPDRTTIERTWLLSVIDNRRALMMDKIIEYEKGIQLARENAQPEVDALYIDGRKIDPDEFLGSYGV